MKENFENKEEIIEKSPEKAEDKEEEEREEEEGQAPEVEDKEVSS